MRRVFLDWLKWIGKVECSINFGDANVLFQI